VILENVITIQYTENESVARRVTNNTRMLHIKYIINGEKLNDADTGDMFNSI